MQSKMKKKNQLDESLVNIKLDQSSDHSNHNLLQIKVDENAHFHHTFSQ